ncbi:gliding motility-associated C-terminal domain-containing protein, partial [Prevotella copri]|nr:gliding motility-associated C-terminal domain-containing protein [Segatella copri]
MLPLLTCQLHAQEVNDDEEDNTEETTKVSSLLM